MLNYKRNNEDSMLLYNLIVTKNFKMKICTQDESKEKQRNPVKIMLIAPELASKKSLSEHWNPNKVSAKSWQGFCDFSEEP